MKQLCIIFISLTLALGNAFGQSDSTTVYNGLETKTYYSVSLDYTSMNGKEIYKANGKDVSKAVYDKYKSKWKNMETCCPCILKSYDENDILLRESVSCTDCGVGWFKYYYPNGNFKLTGSYKENPTGNWDNVWARGYCSVKHGQWTYFNEKGDTLYSEFWDNGKFIKQVPEQNTTEIWDVELILNGLPMDKQIVELGQIGNLKINPRYKNSNKNSKLEIRFEVSAIGHRSNEKRFTIETFKNIDVSSILSEVGISKNKKATYELSVYDNDHFIKRFYLNVKK